MAKQSLSLKQLAGQKKQKCRFCRAGIEEIDYKDVETLQKLITPHGKIQSRKRTGVCSYHQRKVARAVKRARIMALLPFPGSN